MSARPRPKPRPKPKVTSEPSTSATSLESSRAKSPASVNDDDLFIRHDPNRLLYNQKKPREKSPLRDVKYFDNGDSDESPDSKRRKKDLAPKRAKPLPSWTFQTRDPTLANVDSDDDSSELEILEDDAFKDVPSAPLPKPKLRERSITPPPQDLRYQIGNQVHELLQRVFFSIMICRRLTSRLVIFTM
ncbi:unnamed protein product [Rhizoctonia solani]|nr:unnamed protein product [Rhizoctonia solani]